MAEMIGDCPRIREMSEHADMTLLKAMLLWDMEFREQFFDLDEDGQVLIAYYLDSCYEESGRYPYSVETILKNTDYIVIDDEEAFCKELLYELCPEFVNHGLDEYFDYEQYARHEAGIERFRYDGHCYKLGIGASKSCGW